MDNKLILFHFLILTSVYPQPVFIPLYFTRKVRFMVSCLLIGMSVPQTTFEPIDEIS